MDRLMSERARTGRAHQESEVTGLVRQARYFNDQGTGDEPILLLLGTLKWDVLPSSSPTGLR